MEAATREISCEIEFVAPLLQDNILNALKGLKNKGRKKSGNSHDDPEGWDVKVYHISGNSKLGHPSAGIEKALQDAAREFKGDGRRSLLDPVKSTVFVKDQLIELIGKTQPDFIHESTPVNQVTKGRVMTYRPAFKIGTKAAFTLQLLDPEELGPEKIYDILVYAGQRKGLGCWRPRYGRFIVSQFKS